MKSNDVSVIIHSYNAEKHILECIKSAKLLSDNICVIDMYSNDETVEIAEKNGAKIYFFPRTHYVEPAREFGISKIKSDWFFLLDTDERITGQLAEEIKKTIRQSSHSHYKVPRKNIFGRVKWLKNGGWWPDYQTRLINKNYFKSWPKEIHSTPVIAGRQGILTQPMDHFFHGDIKSMVDKTIVFENIESDLLFAANKPSTTLTLFRKFVGELFRRLFINFGFLDGSIGIIESFYQAFSKTITYIYLYEKRRSI